MIRKSISKGIGLVPANLVAYHLELQKQHQARLMKPAKRGATKGNRMRTSRKVP